MEFARRPPLVAQPLVSVLIPAYNPAYFEAALLSLLEQSYPHLDVHICDDCPGYQIRDVAERLAGQDSRFHYHRNEVRLGGMGNYLRCLEFARGALVKFLNDDDLLEPACIETLVNALQSYPEATLSTSSRTLIDQDGNRLPDRIDTRSPWTEDWLVEGTSAAQALVAWNLNFIGEPSTALYRKECLDFVVPHAMSFGGAVMIGVGDVAMWLNLLSQGDLVFLTEPLSRFRIHREQRQNVPEIKEKSKRSWLSGRFHARRLGLGNRMLPAYVRVRRGEGTTWRHARLAALDWYRWKFLEFRLATKRRFLEYFQKSVV